MRVKAIVSFAGNEITMFKGQEADISPSLAKEYIKCGYLQQIKGKKESMVNEDESEPDNNN